MAERERPHLIECGSTEDASILARDSILEEMRSNAAAGDRFRLVLTGGRTPRRLYQLLAEADAPWSNVDWFWSDERCVPPDDEESNFYLVRSLLLDRVSHDPLRVFRMPGEIEPPEDGAASHGEVLERVLGDRQFDFCLLGMGDDGHIASLFPGHPALEERERSVVAVRDSPKPPPLRLSLTLPRLARSKRILVLIEGSAKREIARMIIDDADLARSRWPAALLPLDRVVFIAG